MDILDLSLGEKRSRRKTNAPQRRHGLDHSPSGIEEEQSDASPDDVTDALNKTPLKGAGETKMVALDELKQINQRGLYDEKETPQELEQGNSARSFASSPYESEDKQSVEKDSNDNVTPSPRSLNENVLDQPPHSYHGNYNANSNNNNTINISLTRFPQLPNTTAGSYSNSDPISNLAAFQDRFSALSASMPQSVLRGAIKAPLTTSYGSYDVQPIDAPGIPERTKKQNRWAFNVWREWARKRNLSENSVNGSVARVPLDVGKATEEELDYWLSKFVKEIRRKDGNPYPPHTLMQIVMGIQRYLRQQAGRPSICILDRSNPVYGRFRSVLDSRIKELTTEGVTASHKGGRRSSLPASTNNNTNNNNNYASLNYPEQSVLWEAGIIGNDTALGLLNAVFFHNTVTFGIRNVDDHWNLKMSHFVLGNRGQQAQSYIEFVPSRDPIYINRGLTKDKRVHAEPGNPRCVVKLFQKYLSLVPADGPFYRHPQEPTLVDRSIRFSDQWVGKNRLRAMIKHVFDSTRLDGRERAQSGGPGSSSVASRFPSNHFVPNNDSRASTPNMYDRLAQMMMQLTYLRPNSQISTPASSKSPTITAPASPKSENCDYDGSPSFSQSGPSAAPGRDEIVLKRESSPDSLLEVSQPKRRKTSFDNESETQADAAEEIDDVKVTSSSEKHIEENMLEIAVPRNIDTVVVVKGTKRITVQLD